MNEQHVGVCRNEAAGSAQKPVETMVSVNKEIGEILLEQRCIIGKIGVILFGEISEEEKVKTLRVSMMKHKITGRARLEIWKYFG